jgi:flagella basal body P-ring formation protein FlgA
MAVASRPLLVGERLDQKMIGHAEITVWGPPGPEANSPTPGWIVRRALAPGDRLTPPAVEPAPVLRAGQRVRVVWIIGGVRVAAEGIAQNGAASGGRVRLRLSDRRGHAEGIARSSDSVFIIP